MTYRRSEVVTDFMGKCYMAHGWRYMFAVI